VPSDGTTFLASERLSGMSTELSDNGSAPQAPLLDGIHHLKLPVSDLERSLAWYQDRLGYLVMKDFVEDGVRMGVAMTHPNGGPDLALRLDPPRATAAAGFDYFAIGVPGLDAIEALAARLTASGDGHAGVMRTPVGWVLPGTHDPDGHEVRFYTVPLELPDEALFQSNQGESNARH
jgi:catechol 2,3-dioxygenase-like lactoylglutathione lyase family enzyme